MSDLQHTVRDMFEAIDQRRFNALADYLDPAITFTAPGGDGQGIAAVGEFLTPFLTALPALTHRLDTVAVALDVVTVELTLVGTHTGPLHTPDGPLSATGATIAWPCCHVYRFRAGKAVANHLYFDRAELLAQLTAPSPAAV
ncbi:MAG: nuclear transport factor 2 family protein [Pseudonocardia sp.]|nr:nuclear transport factor 2 family protein [Pseudonocardia sp.]